MEDESRVNLTFPRHRSGIHRPLPDESHVSQDAQSKKDRKKPDDVHVTEAEDVRVLKEEAGCGALSSEEGGEQVDECGGKENTLTGTSKQEYETETFRRRWYILFIFSMSALVWNAVWSTWGPIAQSAKQAYDWTDADIAMFTWLGNAPFLVTMFPIAYLMDVKGLRIAMLLCCGLTFLGSGLRCIPADNSTSTWLIMGGQLINGIAGTVPVAGPGLLSGLWFPQHQRATATAISTVAGNLGVSCSFLIGPLLVPEPCSSFSDLHCSILNTVDIVELKTGIFTLLHLECGAAGLLFLLTFIYFPSKPPKPPNASASTAREPYVAGIKMLLHNRQFWITAIAYSVPAGIYEVWQVVLDVNLHPRVSQETAGWMDLYSTLGGIVSGVLVSRFADMFCHRVKLFLLIFYILAAMSALWFAFLVEDVLSFNTLSVFIANINCGVFLDGGAPLFYELAINVAHPVGEGVTSGVLQLLTSGAGLAFLSVLQIESIGKAWMNWTFFGCIIMTIPFLFYIHKDAGCSFVNIIAIPICDDEDEGIEEQTGTASVAYAEYIRKID